MTRGPSDGDLRALDTDECWELVRSRSIGRFAANQLGSCPLVVPVNYVVDGHDIVFRSGADAKFSAAVHGLVGLQVDEIDPQHHTGWSVLVEGTGIWLYEEQDDTNVETWAPGVRPYVIRITATRLTGRRIDLVQLDTDSRGYR